MNTISVGALRQNPTAMLRDVQNGACYMVTDRGRPVATIQRYRESRWVSGAQLQQLLGELGTDTVWLEEVADTRTHEIARDPWRGEA